MSLDTKNLTDAIAAHGPLIRVVVIEVKGSTPREVGAAMLIWAEGQSGTIGGGALEHEAVTAAQAMLATGEHKRLSQQALGPDLGQCCGGVVRLLYERWEGIDALQADQSHFARPVSDDASEVPPVNTGKPRLIDGWFIEPIAGRATPIWLWGAGHVGRAIIATLAPLPDISLTWLDTGPERFPTDLPEPVTALPAPELPAAMRLAPQDAHHLVLTYSHALDLAICDAGLSHGFASLGVIGSATKWARFRSRLKQMGHSAAAIERIICPIGEKSLGKHPQAIAVGVAHTLLMELAK